jgi:hypothetical protein
MHTFNRPIALAWAAVATFPISCCNTKAHKNTQKFNKFAYNTNMPCSF